MDVSLATSLSALDAFAVSQQVTGNNLANVNTEEFRASRVTFEDRPDLGGVAVQDIQQTPEAPPMVPSMRLLEQQGRMAQESTYVPGSTTDVAREMVNLMVNESAYAANAAVARTRDEMVGTLLDISA
jgi:flagellar basal-body rod protein FlgC